MKKIILSALFATVLAFGLTAPEARAAGAAVELPDVKWSFDGPFGTYDRGSLKRGAQVYFEVCASCHAARLVAYRNLMDVDFSEDEAKAIAANFETEDGPNEDGEMFMRPATLSDKFVSPYPNDNAARAANNGAMPPDLSLMVKARKNGANYLYGLMVGYRDEAPEGFELSEGMQYNAYFPGHQIAMPAPIAEDGVEYADGTKATVEQMSKDITTFLAWTAMPELEQRKRMGVKVLIFLLVLTGLFIALKRKIWADVH